MTCFDVLSSPALVTMWPQALKECPRHTIHVQLLYPLASLVIVRDVSSHDLVEAKFEGEKIALEWQQGPRVLQC